MSRYQLYPLEEHPKSGEPYLRLPSPYGNIILTPPRMSDVDSIVEIINDPLVSAWLAKSKHPLTKDQCESWVLRLKHACDEVLRELSDEAEVPEELKVVSACPIRCLREVKDDGSEVYIGDIGFKRYSWTEVLDIAERTRLVEANDKRSAGDPEIVWQVADFLAPSHHRRGIMTVALARLLQKWAIPRMGVRHIRLVVFEGNDGSLGVFRKTGFKVVDTVPAAVEVRDEKRTLKVLEWKLEDLLNK